MGGVLVGSLPACTSLVHHTPIQPSPLQSLELGADSTPFGLYNVAVGVERKRAAADLPAYGVGAVPICDLGMGLVTNPPCVYASSATHGLNAWMCAYLGQFGEYWSFGVAIHPLWVCSSTRDGLV